MTWPFPFPSAAGLLIPIVVTGCAMDGQQGAGQFRGDILPDARNISPDTRVEAGRDLTTEIEGTLKTELGLFSKEIQAHTAQVSETRYGIGTVGAIAIAGFAFMAGIAASVLVAVVRRWRQRIIGTTQPKPT